MRAARVTLVQLPVRGSLTRILPILNAAISPRSTVGASTPANSLGLIAEAINRAHKATENVVCVLENTVCFLVFFHVFPSHI
jgi:hypothetical protein